MVDEWVRTSGRMIQQEKTEVHGKKTCSSLTFFTTYPTWTGRGTRPSHRGDRLAWNMCDLWWTKIQWERYSSECLGYSLFNYNLSGVPYWLVIPGMNSGLITEHILSEMSSNSRPKFSNRVSEILSSICHVYDVSWLICLFILIYIQSLW